MLVLAMGATAPDKGPGKPTDTSTPRARSTIVKGPKGVDAPMPLAARPKAKGSAKGAADQASKKKKADPKQAAGGVEDLLDKIQAYYSKIEDYQADFIQLYTKVALSRTTEQRGVLSLKKPSQMRWAYTKPIEKLWVVNGDTLYLVDPEFEQVIIDENFKTAELQKSIQFLWGKGRLDDTFHVTAGDDKAHGAGAGIAVLELKPKRGATYKKLVLLVDEKTGGVTESIIFETAGNKNHFKFRNPKHNSKLAKGLFEYTPPAGYEVIHR